MKSIQELGFSAGILYNAGKDKEMSITELKKTSGLDEKTLNMVLGWLAREGKVEFITKKKKILIRISG
ncbi:MAG: winged helix-turn-helix domain-containing protein [Methanobacteriota archaeon]